MASAAKMYKAEVQMIPSPCLFLFSLALYGLASHGVDHCRVIEMFGDLLFGDLLFFFFFGDLHLDDLLLFFSSGHQAGLCQVLLLQGLMCCLQFIL